MRPLTEEETKTFFAKLAKYLGRNITTLLDNNFCFRLHKDRVYYMSEELLKYSNSVNNKQLISVGTCFGKFTQSGKFRLAITALPELVQFAKYKVWVKPNGEMSYMYGNHILKAHLGKITEDCPQHQGVIILTMADIPIGFGVTAKATNECRKMDPTAICVFHQTDVGEFLRDEDVLF